MEFEEALLGHPLPRRVGDVSFRFEDNLLIGEGDRDRRADAVGQILWVGGIAAGLGCLVTLVGGALSPAVVFGVAAAGCVVAAGFADQRARTRRRFVLNFEDETLRVDRWARLRPRTDRVPFDAVRAVELRPGPAGGALWVSLQHQEMNEEVLFVRAIRGGDQDTAQRLRRILRGAFGLSPPEGE